MEKKIYNKEKKTSFLNTLSQKEQTHARRMFGQTYEFESSIGKDISELDSIDEIKKCISSIIYVDNTSKIKYTKYFRMYFDFYGNDFIKVFSSKEIQKYMTKKERCIFTPQEIRNIEEKINKIYGEKAWYYNAILYCTFYGFSIVKLEDFANIKISDLDKEKQIIRLSNNRIIDYKDKPELIKYLQLTIDNQCEYNYQNNGHVGYVGMYEESIFKYSVKKLIFDPTQFVRSTSKRINDALKYSLDQKVILKNISDSGFCYYVKHILEDKGTNLSDFLASEPKHKNSFISNAIFEFGIDRSLAQATDILSEYSMICKNVENLQ